MTITDVTKKFSRTPSSTERAAKVLPLVIGGVRAALGVALLAAPGQANQVIAGKDAALPSVKVTARLFGAREVFVGAGVLAATKAGPAVLRSALQAGVALDAVDAVSFGTTGGLPTSTRALTVTAALGYAALGLYTLSILDD